jgi:hypothetical protein
MVQIHPQSSPAQLAKLHRWIPAAWDWASGLRAAGKPTPTKGKPEVFGMSEKSIWSEGVPAERCHFR